MKLEHRPRSDRRDPGLHRWTAVTFDLIEPLPPALEPGRHTFIVQVVRLQVGGLWRVLTSGTGR